MNEREMELNIKTMLTKVMNDDETAYDESSFDFSESDTEKECSLNTTFNHQNVVYTPQNSSHRFSLIRPQYKFSDSPIKHVNSMIQRHQRKSQTTSSPHNFWSFGMPTNKPNSFRLGESNLIFYPNKDEEFTCHVNRMGSGLQASTAIPPMQSMTLNLTTNPRPITPTQVTPTQPQSTNSQNSQFDILIYELSNLLSKSEKIDHFIYTQLKGNFVSLLKTHKGSRIFQNYLKNTQSDILHQIFCEISVSLPVLMSDPYGNYFCQRFFLFLNQRDRIQFLSSISSSLTQISINSIGTYPVQGLIEQVGSKVEKNIIISGIKNDISKLAFDSYGTHVLEKIISCFEEEYISFIFDFGIENFNQLSNHQNGICVIKKMLTLTHKKDLHEKLKKIIADDVFSLIQKPYGNYVIQVIIDCWDEKEVREILLSLKGKFGYLAKQKYSSNIVERCIEKDLTILEIFIDENENNISELMKNNYGNFVVQKAIKISIGELKKKIIENVSKNVNKLNNRKLISKWNSIIYSNIDRTDLMLCQH